MTTFFTAQHTPFRRGLTTLMMLALLVIGFTSQATVASAESTWVGPYDGGCYYLWDGAQYVEVQCRQADGSFASYVPGANGWVYSAKTVTDANGVTYTTYVDGTYRVAYPDGSFFLMGPNRLYGVWDTDGTTIVELGVVDAGGNRIKGAVRDASGTLVKVGTTTTATGSGTIPSGTTIEQINERYNNMRNGITDNTPPPACSHILPSQDYDNDGRIENSDIYDRCEG